MYWALLEPTMKFIRVFLSLQAKIFLVFNHYTLFGYHDNIMNIMTVPLTNSFYHLNECTNRTSL